MKKVLFSVLLLAMQLFAVAQLSISGKVTDVAKNPIPGANVVIEGTNIGAVTNVDGKFSLSGITEHQVTLKVSFVGYKKFEVLTNVNPKTEMEITLIEETILAEEVLVKATRSSAAAPGSKSSLQNNEISRQNLGADLPYMLALTPSVTISSDAGTGIGYTNFRIRGTDANRINVTVNGIPLNDAESHGVFWVNMPDFASSTENIEIQRGAGTSTNGAGAFGASINMQTSGLQHKPYAETDLSAGSFNTTKATVKVGTGLLANHFAFDARLSQITSDGFIDRASSDLKSYYLSGGYYSEKTLVKLTVFSGAEKTYQSWNGIPKVRLESDSAGMQRYEDHYLYTHEQTQHMMQSGARTYNMYTYENETDNYKQDHYQMHFSHLIHKNITFNAAMHYTYGRGYYEQYRTDDDLSDYHINNIVIGGDTVTNTDLIRQKWLNNDFYGITGSLIFSQPKYNITIGGAANNYNGRHYGNVIWGQLLGDIQNNYEWYRNTGTKSDLNVYAKGYYEFMEALSAYVDLQYRQVDHSMNGYDDDARNITQSHSYKFFNPKLGLRYLPLKALEVYGFYSRANREPNRSNFTDAPEGQTPKAEQLDDFELGAVYIESSFKVGANGYYMLYADQLILTGQINDVGSAIMTNVDKSYRLGVEIFGGFSITDYAKIDANVTLSENKIENFTEYVDDWDNGGQQANHFDKTDIAFSPNMMASGALRVYPVKQFEVSLTGNYVSKQFIDNSMSESRMLNSYFVSNLQLQYSFATDYIKETTLKLMVNNLFNQQYESNAWVYSYLYGGQRYEMDGYFTQAGINIMAGVSLKF